MTPLTARFSFLLFAVLTGAMLTNLFVLQPPGRMATTEQARARTSPQSGSSVATADQAVTRSAIVPPIETGAVKPLPETADKTDLTRAIQRELKEKGYEAGAVDGVAGLVTRGAIMAYEADAGLPLTGEPRPALLQHLVLGSADAGSSGGGDRQAPSPEAEQVIRAVQSAFRQLGYLTTVPDGRLNDATRRAIRKFELDRKLKETGRISGELLAKLASVAGDALRTAQH